MTRFPFVALVLLAQILAGFLPRGIVLCVHVDGRSRIELVTALCCDLDRPGDPSSPSPDEPMTRGLSIHSDPNCCEDLPLLDQQVFLARSLRELASTHAPLPLGGSFLETASVDAFPALGPCTPARCCGPPPDSRLLQILTVVLRC